MAKATNLMAIDKKYSCVCDVRPFERADLSSGQIEKAGVPSSRL